MVELGPLFFILAFLSRSVVRLYRMRRGPRAPRRAKNGGGSSALAATAAGRRSRRATSCGALVPRAARTLPLLRRAHPALVPRRRASLRRSLRDVPLAASARRTPLFFRRPRCPSSPSTRLPTRTPAISTTRGPSP